MALGDDERPPIIVRGGSLVIQSGKEKSSNPKHETGKDWIDIKDRKRWKQKHDDGKHVAAYSVSFPEDGKSCSPAHVPEVRVTYQPTSGDPVVVVIGRELSANGKDMEPLITSTAELTAVNGTAQPTLTFPSKGTIVSIAAGSNVCSNPVSAILQPVDGRDSDSKRSARVLIALATIAVVLLGFAFALGLFDRNGDEERPPIIVRNGSIVFENDLVGSTGQSKHWVPSGSHKWKPDHDKGLRVREFHVTFTGVECDPMTGQPVDITRSTGESFQVKREGVFRVDPKDKAPQDATMTPDNSLPKATLTSDDAGGYITEVRIGNQRCNTSEAKAVIVTIKPQ